MIEVHPGLYVGSQQDYEMRRGELLSWMVIHACKEPYHRQALGYAGRCVAHEHPEYLVARRGNRLILNLVDAADPAYIPDTIVDAAVAEIYQAGGRGQPVLLHCNLGQSRSPSIAMVYLGTHTGRLSRSSFEDAHAAFSLLYPPFAPAAGMLGFLRRRWAALATR